MIRWLIKEYKCNNPNLIHHNEMANALLQQFVDVMAMQIPKEENKEVNDLAQ